jgi:hypothetical protein
MARPRQARATEPPKKELEAHLCQLCPRWGCFGLGPPLRPQIWYCRAHVPDDYWSLR